MIIAAKGCSEDTESSEGRQGDFAGVCIPEAGCGSLEEDEPSPQRPFLRASKDWKGHPLASSHASMSLLAKPYLTSELVRTVFSLRISSKIHDPEAGFARLPRLV